MNRVDSAFNESLNETTKPAPETPVKERTKMCSRRRRHEPADAESTVDGRPTQTKSQQTDEKKSANGHHASSTRRPSVGSSNPSTTNTGRHHPGSKHSSRRGAATVIDPSRPTRHYRVHSSQTAPTAGRDVDDVLALHFRSCSLFQNPCYSAPHPSIAGHGNTSTGMSSPRPSPPAQYPSSDSADSTQKQSSEESNESPNPDEISNTVMHWTTSKTRRKEYEDIDRSNSGVRLLIRRITPRCVTGPPPPKFYQENVDDTGSVRRYRMDLPESDDDEVEDEKNARNGKTENTEMTFPASRKKNWLCF